MTFEGDITKALLILRPSSHCGEERVSAVRHLLFEAGFIIVREEYRVLNAEVVETICAGHSAAPRQSLVGQAFVYAVARYKCAEELKNFVVDANLTDTTYCCQTAATASGAVLALFPRMVVDPIPTNTEARDYVAEELQGVLLDGLTELAKEKPQNSIEWLARYLLEHNPKSPPVTVA